MGLERAHERCVQPVAQNLPHDIVQNLRPVPPQGVVRDKRANLKDFTRLRGLGADAGDVLGKLFEIKAHGGDIPDSVSIELSEVRAAKDSPGDFYLAVVGGLEEGYETVIRLFARPLESLDWAQGTSIKLLGVHSKRAIEVRLGSG